VCSSDLTSGVGLFVAEHREDIGPWAIAGAIGLAAAACLAWVARTSPPFSRSAVDAPSVAFDYVLLLGLLLLATDLAYVEVEFTPLGPNWPHHLLLVAVVYAAAAYRWDSRTALGLALASLAAWRGISTGLVGGSLWRGDPRQLRADALALGALYLAAAAVSAWRSFKPHFEAVFATSGLLLLLGALVSGALDRRGWSAWLAALLAAALAVTAVAFRLRRSLYFALGVAAAYVGVLRLVFAPFRHDGAVFLFLAALLGLAAIWLITAAHRRIDGP